MKDFTRKLEQMDTLFICKFSVSDYVNHQFKIYFISPDSDHQYMVVNQIQNNDHNHECFVGNLFLDSKGDNSFEDTHIESFILNRKNYNDFVRYFNLIPKWEKRNIKEIEKNHGKNLVFD